MKQCCFSAPGKALLAGGYLVLERDNKSFVTALSARIFAVASFDDKEDTNEVTITVESPQFFEGKWIYKASKLSNGYVSVEQLSKTHNPFTESAIRTVLNYLSSSASGFDLRSTSIVVLSDNAYHSQPYSSVPKFNKHRVRIHEVPKTGLGSSAALTTSVVASLFALNTGFDLDDSTSKRIIHNMAQISHCLAQGKIGSGFDVATAVYGSIVYRRFESSLISDIPSSTSIPAEYLRGLKKTVEQDWKIDASPCYLPRRLCLLMGDISGGSETPTLVRLVLSWRKSDPSAEYVWRALGQSNESLINSIIELSHIADSNVDEYNNFVDQIVSMDSANIKKLGSSGGTCIAGKFEKVIDAINSIRHYLKEMTIKSGAQIEPDEQTALLDECAKIPGVLGGVVPGAGGYDAICLIACEDAVPKIISTTSSLLPQVRWLDLREESVGLQKVDIESLLEYLP
ncbi:ribosomal protein S5 domain 2-type protein [Dipodascopsis uninucleata]